jgi:hypothetical protein
MKGIAIAILAFVWVVGIVIISLTVNPLWLKIVSDTVFTIIIGIGVILFVR